MSGWDARELREIAGIACQRFVSIGCSASSGAAEITATTAIKIRTNPQKKLTLGPSPNRVIFLAILWDDFSAAEILNNRDKAGFGAQCISGTRPRGSTGALKHWGIKTEERLP